MIADTCHEDMQCWTWPVMGNHRRGVMLDNGTRRVVGPCAFRRLVEAGRVTLRGQRLKGDVYALKHGCR